MKSKTSLLSELFSSKYMFIAACILTAGAVGVLVLHNYADKKRIALTNASANQSSSSQGTLTLGNSNSDSGSPDNSQQLSNSQLQTLDQEIAQDEANYKKDEALAQQDESIAQQDYSSANNYNPTPAPATPQQTVVSAPTQEPFPELGSYGSLSGTYYYAITFVSANGTETNLGPNSLAISPASQEIFFESIPTSSNNTVTKINLYRTKANSSSVGPYYLVNTFYGNNSEIYYDDTPDSSLILSPKYE